MTVTTEDQLTQDPWANDPWIDRLGHKIYSPTRLLILLTTINAITYFDVGVMSAVLPEVAKFFNINHTQQGTIASSYNVGFMICCPVAAAIAAHVRPKYVIIVGLALLAVAMGACGLCSFSQGKMWGFYLLIACRAITGIGESAFVSLAQPVIDDIAPTKHRSLYLSIYYMAIPVGVSLGFATSAAMLRYFSWPYPFFLEAALVVLFLLLYCFVPSHTDHYRSQKENSENATLLNKTQQKVNVFTAVSELSQNPVYMFALLGYIFFEFVVGAFSFWGPSIVHYTQRISLQTANLAFAGLMLFNGLLGAFAGGFVLDRMGGSHGMRGASRASFLCSFVLVICLLLGTSAFFMNNVIVFFIFLTLSLFFGMCATSPNSTIFLSVVDRSICNFSI
ncbi:sphingolipid transporter Spinster, partial [Acrasis kona]